MRNLTNTIATLEASQGYVLEHVPTPLASGGAGLLVDQSLNYNFLEKNIK